MNLRREISASNALGRIPSAFSAASRLRKAAVLLLLAAVLPATAAAEERHAEAAAGQIAAGKRIYTEGILPSGAPLTATRFGSSTVSGADAACINCHRGSGMGEVEGNVLVPPITGNFLYAMHKDMQYAIMDPRVSKRFNPTHPPYTDASFETAVNLGVDNLGHKMDLTMPRYKLSAVQIKALLAYLGQLSSDWSPGVLASSIRFATVITPDVDPARRKAFITMLQTIVRQKNGSTETGVRGRTRHHMTSAAEMVLGTERKWDLDIWELKGAPETWGAQLEADYQVQPVFALLSGLTGSTWQPVHDFCDKEHVPCWFPSTVMPGEPQSQYAFYFSGGVLLEADVLARYLQDEKNAPTHLIQIYRDDTVGKAAAAELKKSLQGTRITVEDRALAVVSGKSELQDAFSHVKSGDVVMCWLRDDDVAALAKSGPAKDVRYYFSSRLSRVNGTPLTEQWKAHSDFVYLYELPQNRTLNLDYFHAWMNLRNFPIVDEAMQSEVFFSANFMTDTVSEMLNNLYRDYMVERAETGINKREGSKSEQETRDRFALGRQGDLVKRFPAGTKTIAPAGERIQMVSHVDSTTVSHGTTMYPRLSLASDQRIASKGGYIVSVSGKQGEQLVDESGWIVP